jgi:hypothetical protein
MTSALRHDQPAECPVGNLQTGVELLGAAVPDRVLVLDGYHAVVVVLG